MNLDRCVSACDAMIDRVQSVVEKMKLFPIPLSTSAIAGKPSTALTADLKQTRTFCIAIGTTVVHLRKVLPSKGQEVSTKLLNATIELDHAISVLRDKINRHVLMLLASWASVVQDRPNARYSFQFRDVLRSLDRHLDRCSDRIEALVEHIRLPTLTKTTFYLHKMVALSARDPSFLPNFLEDVHDRLEKFIQEAASRRDLMPAATAQFPMISNDTAIQRLMTARTTPKRNQPTKAELEGFISRIKTTRREPNWKMEFPLPPQKSLPATPTHGSFTSTSRSLESPAPSEGPENWPLDGRRSDDAPSLATTVSIGDLADQVAISSIEDVYDSYHDHDVDATLGLAGPNAVAALKRQPSHRKQLGQAPLFSSTRSSSRRPNGTAIVITTPTPSSRSRKPNRAPRPFETPRTHVSASSQKQNVDPMVVPINMYKNLPSPNIRDQYY